jgi:xylulokinase
MSFIGIDVGSTGTKVAAYDSDGRVLGSVYAEHTPHRPFPGAWEIDPEEIWNNATNGLRQLASRESLRRNPPRALAISGSTREGFPVDSAGKPLGPCIMTADTRVSGLEESISKAYTPEEWFEFCGHTPERMDPVCRILWWERNHPDIMRKAAYFVGWGEYFCLRFTGKAVIDHSHAGRFLVYDFRTHQWSPERISKFGVNAALLPEIRSWGTTLGPIRKDVTTSLGFVNDVEMAVGANDAVCTVLGTGVSRVGTGCLISGSWENLLLPVTSQPPASTLINAGVSIGPYPGKASWLIYCLSPTGSATLNWARSLVNVKLDEAEASLANSGKGPGHVLGVPHISGATATWVGGSNLRGALLGMTLATSPLDVVKAFMEGIAYDIHYLIEALKAGGAKIEMIRGVGGGVRSEWWNQLKADLTDTVIETVDQPELGTLGAALLAGKAVGAWDDLEAKAEEFTRASKRYNPDRERARLYNDRMSFYRSLITEWLAKDWSVLSSS